MKAMILAAGRGERMRPLTDHTPKPLLQIANKPLIEWHIERLVSAGFSEIVINHAYLGQQIETALGNGSKWNINIAYSPEAHALETAGGIANALPLLGHHPFLVVNGDVFCTIDFKPLKTRLNQPNLAHLVMVQNPPQHPTGDFALEDGQLMVSGDSTLTFSGVGVYDPALFQAVPKGKAAKLAPLLITAMQAGHVTGEYFNGVWHDIGTPERLAQINRIVQSQQDGKNQH